jgi:hypothetical protein
VHERGKGDEFKHTPAHHNDTMSRNSFLQLFKGLSLGQSVGQLFHLLAILHPCPYGGPHMTFLLTRRMILALLCGGVMTLTWRFRICTLGTASQAARQDQRFPRARPVLQLRLQMSSQVESISESICGGESEIVTTPLVFASGESEADLLLSANMGNQQAQPLQPAPASCFHTRCRLNRVAHGMP